MNTKAFTWAEKWEFHDLSERSVLIFQQKLSFETALKW